MARSPWRTTRPVRPRLAVVAGLAAAAIVAMLAALFAPPATPISGRAEIVDGDTLRIGSTRVRLTGLDAPELDQTCTGADGGTWPCGQQARGFVIGLVAHETLSCLPSGHDRYGRTLARCNVEGADIGQQIVSAGWAVADMSYFPEAAGAQAARRGIWAGSFLPPAEWRRTGGGTPASLWDWMRGWFGG